MGIPDEVHLTYADYRQLPEDGRRYEILEGTLAVSPSAKAIHQLVVWNLTALLTPWIVQRRLGILLQAPMDVILADDTILQPDLLFISKARVPVIVKDWVHGAPDLVIEVASPGTRALDQGAKRHIYERFHVREYWLVDPEARTITILVLDGEKFRELASATGDLVLESPILQGFRFIPAEVFRDISPDSAGAPPPPPGAMRP